MFWPIKKKAKKKAVKPKKPSREDILAQAKATVAAKRAEIGEETLDKIREAIMKKENSALEQAKRKIMDMDDDKVRDNLSLWLRDKE